ncbi:hypothetical protein [Barnesiella viscericola]|uniref:hypothetical protein n=1 Tax=Barnesiella viscericola TaxID=397865 RepID=UPI00255B464C|nr:hypothetical protein [Barnesiella viscericola]
MNNLKTYASNGGNGIYGWDLVNPYLQELYRQQENDDDAPETPPYIAPLPGEKTQPMPFGGTPERETPIPLKPDYPVNPGPEQPAEDPRKLHSLTEGLNLAGKRIWNDLKYARGYIQDKFSDDEMDEAAQSALENLPTYESSSEAQLQQKADSLENEIERQPGQRPRIELKGLEEYRRLRDEDIPRNEIARQLAETARWGNDGRRIMEEARATDKAFPETEGWASVGEFAADIARMGIPVAIGAMSAPAGIAAGGLSVGSAATESFSQAQMELDNFEEETGQKLSTGQRAAYTALSVGADFLFDALLQSRFFKNLGAGAKARASNYFKKTILNNKSTRAEMDKLMKNLKKTDRKGVLTGAFNDAAVSGAAGGLSSATHDIAQAIYVNPDEYPTLSSVLLNASVDMVTGGIAGGVAGGISRSANLRKKNIRRKNQDKIAVINFDGEILEVIDYDPRNQTATVILPFQREPIEIPDIEPDMIHSVSVNDYNQNRQLTKELNEPDLFAPVVPDADKDQAWAQMSSRGKYLMAKDLAERMGIDNVLIYERESDLPPRLLAQKKGEGTIRGFQTSYGPIGIVLENEPSYESLQHTLLHEAVGHRGFDALFRIPELKNEFFLNVYKSMPKEFKTPRASWFEQQLEAQEYLAYMAGQGVRSSAWDMIAGELRGMLRMFYPGLRFSNAELRQLIVRSRNALKRDDSLLEMRQKLMNRESLSPERSGIPMTEAEEETYRLLWENDPQWRRYKRFYDEVYGPDEGSLPSDSPTPPANGSGNDNPE